MPLTAHTVMAFPRMGIARLAGPSRPTASPLHLRQFRSLRPLSSNSYTRSMPPLIAPSSILQRSYPLQLAPRRHSPITITRLASTTAHPNSPPNPNPHTPPPEPEPEPSSAYARFRVLSKKYGWYAVAVYLALSVVDFSLTFAVVHALGAERIEPSFKAVMHQYRVLRYGETEALRVEEESRKEEEVKEAEEKAELEKLSSEERKKKQSSMWGSRTFWAEVVLAYAIHKTLLLPFRAGLTVAWTPALVKWLTRRGWVGKGGLGRAAEHAKGRVQDASQKVRARAKRTKPHRVDHKH